MVQFSSHKRTIAVLCSGAILTAALVGGVTMAANAATPAASSTSAVHDAHHGRHRHVRHGTIESIRSTSWTIDTARGKTVTVEVGSATKYGTRKDPSSASSFTSGEKVAVIVRRDGHVLHASRIRPAAHPSGGSSS